MKNVKLVIVLVIIIIININVLASVVSDNDGSAFITKAEFDSLKNDFQSQINNYNTQIDNKIDSAISSYLAGISTELEKKVITSFELIGDMDDSTSDTIYQVHFMGKNKNIENSNNIPKSDAIVSWVGCIGYSATETWSMDSNNTAQLKGTYSAGEANNCVLESDGGYVEEFLVDANVIESRSMVAFAHQGTLLFAGGVWKSVTISLNEPTEQQVKEWTTTTTVPVATVTHECWGFRTTTGGSYSWTAGPLQYYMPRATQTKIYYAYGTPHINWLVTGYSVSNQKKSIKSVNYH